MKRPELIEGNLYYIKAYEIGLGGVPLKNFHQYIIRYLKRDGPTSSGRQVLILATTQPNRQHYPGIPHHEMKSWSLDFESVGDYNRIFFMGKNKDNDCMEVEEFETRDLPICIGWHYKSDELIDQLQEGSYLCLQSTAQ